jgi:hypothetical protein
MKTITKNSTPAEIHEAIQEAGKQACHATRDARDLEVGQAIHQGDLYLVKVADDFPHGTAVGGPGYPVGEGGDSNHVIQGEGVVCYEGSKMPGSVPKSLNEDVPLSSFIGALVKVPESGATLTHKHHAHFTLGAGCYQAVYQVDARTQQRVQD